MCKRGDIFQVAIKCSQGSEQSFNRPCLILQNDIGNLHSTTTIVALITREKSTNYPMHVHAKRDNTGLRYDSTILLEQILTIDKSRLIKIIGKASPKTMEQVNKAIMVSLGLSVKQEPSATAQERLNQGIITKEQFNNHFGLLGKIVDVELSKPRYFASTEASGEFEYNGTFENLLDKLMHQIDFDNVETPFFTTRDLTPFKYKMAIRDNLNYMLGDKVKKIRIAKDADFINDLIALDELELYVK